MENQIPLKYETTVLKRQYSFFYKLLRNQPAMNSLTSFS